jgi:hypothetical protein
MEPEKLLPTWRNFRTENEEVAKRLYRFLFSKELLELGLKLKSKVEDGGISDHRPISLQWKPKSEAPPCSLENKSSMVRI